MTTTNTLLSVENIYLERDGVEILKGINLHVSEGEIHCLLGRNGSGKSTLSYMLVASAGYQPRSGRIIFAGDDITSKSMTERARRGITLAWQEPARFEGLQVNQYLKLGMKEPSDEKVRVALREVALDPDLYLRRKVDDSLSGGERKRIELAAVYAMRSRLAILDEPDSGVDVLSINEIRDLFVRMRNHGMTLLLITHREEMVEVADRASIICSGEITRTGNPEEVMMYYCDRCEVCSIPQEVEELSDYERI